MWMTPMRIRDVHIHKPTLFHEFTLTVAAHETMSTIGLSSGARPATVRPFSAQRITERWNRLPASVVEVSSLNTFKFRTDALYHEYIYST